jgi:DNA mismatch repair ATPase MutL
VQDFLTNIPVRRQAAIKGAAKVITSARKLLSAYAFARPATRFSFKVLRAKNDKANWSFAPSTADSTLLAATGKIVGSEVSAQLLSQHIMSDDCPSPNTKENYKLEALLIDPDSGWCSFLFLPVS